MSKQIENSTENEKQETGASDNPASETAEEMQASMDGLNEALAGLSAIVGTVAAATAQKPGKKDG